MFGKKTQHAKKTQIKVGKNAERKKNAQKTCLEVGIDPGTFAF